jgi:hypothetical protein
MSETKDSLLQIRNEKQELLGKTFHLRNSHEVKMKILSIEIFQKLEEDDFHLVCTCHRVGFPENITATFPLDWFLDNYEKC